MYKLSVFLVMALLACENMSFRIRRQSGTVPILVATEENTETTTSEPIVTIVFNTTDEANTTLSDLAMSIVTQQCIKDCPTTMENNPVCGSNGQMYLNEGTLFCEQACGIDVKMVKYAPCP